RANPNKRFDIDDNASALLTFERGSGTAVVSWTSPSPEWFFEVLGDEGAVTYRKDQLVLRRLKKEPEVLTVTGDGFEGIMRAFVEGLEQDREFSPGFEDAFLALSTARAVIESSKTGKTILLDRKN